MFKLPCKLLLMDRWSRRSEQSWSQRKDCFSLQMAVVLFQSDLCNCVLLQGTATKTQETKTEQRSSENNDSENFLPTSSILE